MSPPTTICSIPVNTIATAAYDCTAMYVIVSATRFPLVHDRVRVLGPDIFEDAAERSIARMAMTGQPWSPEGLTRTERARADALARAVDACTVPITLEWAMGFVDLLAERRFAPIFASQLTWGAQAIVAGTPTRTVMTALNTAGEITLGIKPFDPAAKWEDAA